MFTELSARNLSKQLIFTFYILVLSSTVGCGKMWSSMLDKNAIADLQNAGIAPFGSFPSVFTQTATTLTSGTNIVVSQDGNYLYLTDPAEHKIAAFNNSVPMVPTPLNSLVLTNSDSPNALEVMSSNRMLLSVTGTNRLVWVNTSVPGTPSLQGSLTVAQPPFYMTHVGTTAYVVTQSADFTANAGLLLTIDLSSDAPVLASQISLPGSGLDVTVDISGKYLYVTDDYNSVFYVYNISTPLNPVLVNSVPSPSSNLQGTRTVSVFKNTLSVGFWGIPGDSSWGNGGFAHYDISNPANPVLLSYLETTVVGPHASTATACPVILNLGQNNICTSVYASQTNFSLSNFATAGEVINYEGSDYGNNASWMNGRIVAQGNYLYAVGQPSNSQSDNMLSEIFIWKLQ